MRIIPKTKQEWFGLFPLALKLWVMFAFPAAVISINMMPKLSSHPYQELLKPILVSYPLVCVLLLGVGVFHLWQRSEKVIWDFAFEVLGLICWLQVFWMSAGGGVK